MWWFEGTLANWNERLAKALYQGKTPPASGSELTTLDGKFTLLLIWATLATHLLYTICIGNHMRTRLLHENFFFLDTGNMTISPVFKKYLHSSPCAKSHIGSFGWYKYIDRQLVCSTRLTLRTVSLSCDNHFHWARYKCLGKRRQLCRLQGKKFAWPWNWRLSIHISTSVCCLVEVFPFQVRTPRRNASFDRVVPCKHACRSAEKNTQ